MYLKSLELSGFKSFAKKSALDFKAKTTAIVGPNGSGKSNVAEGFRFVLGEQSIKSMRGKKGEDLIWNGSQEQPRANRASVKAVFDNHKKIFNVDFDEVAIERVVNRDGANEYYINGSQVRLKDVMELLAHAHIGASGHHIISQGEADRVLTSSIKDRRAMIEDALGLKIYQYKRQESQRKLEKTFENINQVESLRREIAPHLKFLRKQVEKAEKAFEIKGKLVTFYREYLKREKIYIDDEKRKINEEKEPLMIKLEELTKLNGEAKELLEKSEKRDSKSDELLSVENELKLCRERKDTLEREAGRLEGEINANSRAIERTLERARSAEHKTVLLKEIEKLTDEIFSEADAVLKISTVESLQIAIQSIKNKLEKFLDSKRDNVEDTLLEDVRKQILELEKKVQEIEINIKEQQENLEQLEKRYSDIKSQIEKEKEGGRVAEKELFRIAGDRSLTQSLLHVLKVREESHRITEEDFLREVQEAGVLLGQSVVGFANDEVNALDSDRKVQEDRRREIEKMKIRLEEFGLGGGEEVIKEFNETSERDQFLEKELSDLTTSSESLTGLIVELEERLNVEFKEGITKINKAFNDFFSLMFGGGSASLEIVEQKKKSKKTNEIETDLSSTQNENYDDAHDDEEDGEEGLDINVALPRKRVKGLTMLSGGERALTSIALLFAISQVNPPPFIILDETDAALDEANSKKYGDMIESLSKYSQLILITHNRETMSRAGVIYGVTMGSAGVSKLLSIQFDEAVTVAK